MLNIAVCDGNRADAAKLEDGLRSYQAERANLRVGVYFCGSGEALLKIAADMQVLLMDILLPDMDGIELAKRLHAQNPRTVILFATASRQHALEAYGVPALRYLLKPVSREQLFSAMDDALHFVDRPPEELLRVKTPQGQQTLELNQIIYIRSSGHTVNIYLQDGRTMVSRTLRMSFSDYVAPLVASGRFIRSHQSYVVNRDCIESVTVDSFQLRDGTIIPISEKKYAQARVAWES